MPRRTRQTNGSRRVKRALLEVKPSPIAGMGAFALRRIGRGTQIIEYRGERITPQEADARYAGGPAVHPIVLLFSVNSRTVIDAGVNGNEARYINHSCAPNCEAVTRGRRIWIYALTQILPGEELTYDYNLIGEKETGDADRTQYACHCGAPNCRGTMLRPHAEDR
jgi:hypothetical protein